MLIANVITCLQNIALFVLRLNKKILVFGSTRETMNVTYLKTFFSSEPLYIESSIKLANLSFRSMLFFHLLKRGFVKVFDLEQC
jgi:hypothetical protein